MKENADIEPFSPFNAVQHAYHPWPFHEIESPLKLTSMFHDKHSNSYLYLDCLYCTTFETWRRAAFWAVMSRL